MTARQKLTVVAQRDGVSSTGTLHGLLVEATEKGKMLRFTVTGHDGKKRHAAVSLTRGETVSLLTTVQEYLDGLEA
ncbi:hypothetical protein KIV63_gp11 [Mycobacterium phage SWU2]|uniref:Uncharacterized protein n=1 Tax=Mycobacterium phage SWU2 TaxID=2077150 RepID=A0A2K9VI65_9CAUD|nr:hypothetical protein KIV63_gp11 [Mycobacterium phage SWU2]AUV62033.1 hypothetical protein JX_gp74 [Mycobacterium phage SWU2]